MAQQGEKKGFIARMLEGKERDEDYARSTLPTNRWALFWDIFKGRFSKIVIVNLLMLVFCLPLIVLYNGKRGKYRLKYFFYAFYPLHLALLAAIYLALNPAYLSALFA